jgi:hypothetical protein
VVLSPILVCLYGGLRLVGILLFLVVLLLAGRS